MQAMGGPILTNSASYDVLKRKQLPFWDAPALKVLVVLIFTLPVAAVANYCDEYVCLSICLFICPRRYLRNHTCDLSQIFYARCLHPWLGPPPTCIAYCREGVFFPIENALSAGKGGWECTVRAKYAIYDCLVLIMVNSVTR